MDTNAFSDKTPLSRFLDDDNITIMENIIPYCSSSAGRILALQIKLIEIQKILTDYHEGPLLRACGLEDRSGDMESMLLTIRNAVSEEKAPQIDSILQMLRFSRMYQQFSEMTQAHPEILKMMETLGGKNEEDNPEPADAFSDPSLFLMLNSVMNNNEGHSGDQMKKILDLAMSRLTPSQKQPRP